jgi:hypothetical protein
MTPRRQEAARAYDEAALKTYGENSPTKFNFRGNGNAPREGARRVTRSSQGTRY